MAVQNLLSHPLVSSFIRTVSEWKSPFENPRTRRITLLIIVVIGAILRIAMCFIGFPYQLHTDEDTVVNPALTMIEDQSYLTYAYYHPNHLQIKICAVLFEIYSQLFHGVDASTLGEVTVFYVIARLVTAACGIASIPVVHCVAERLLKGSGVFAAFAVAFYPSFITRSGLATPDVPLTLIVAVLMYLGLRYLSSNKGGSTSLAIAMGITVAFGILTKYPAILFSISVILILLFVGIREREIVRALRRILVAALTTFVVVMIISPNLLTDFSSMMAVLQNEARSTHLGADGLGYGGNFLFYLQSFFSIEHTTSNDTPYTNWEMLIPLVLGIAFVARRKPSALLVFSPGLLLLFVLSAFGLHWLRWGLPMYVGPLIMVGIGCYAMAALTMTLFARAQQHKALKRLAGILCVLCVSIIAVNAFVSSLTISKTAVVAQTRVEALAYCEENGITTENSAYDGYTPLKLAGRPWYSQDSFADPASDLVLLEDTDIEYVVISSYMYDRYDADNPDHASAIAYYEALRSQCEEVASWESNKIEQPGPGILNIMAKIAYLLTSADECLSGPDIYIYRLPSE